MWLLTVLMGDHINGVFYKEMYGRFAGLKKSGCNNEVTVFTKVAVRLDSTVMEYEKVRIVNHCYAIFFFIASDSTRQNLLEIKLLWMRLKIG